MWFAIRFIPRAWGCCSTPATTSCPSDAGGDPSEAGTAASRSSTGCVPGSRQLLRLTDPATAQALPGILIPGKRSTLTMFELMDAYSQSAVIKVIGVGGGG